MFTIFDEVLTPGFTCFSLEVALVEGLGDGESVVSVAVLLSSLRVLMPFFLSCSLLGEYDCLTPEIPDRSGALVLKKHFFLN